MGSLGKGRSAAPHPRGCDLQVERHCPKDSSPSKAAPQAEGALCLNA